MSAPAAIAAVLVDIRNVGVHKSLKLTIHVPEEQALAAIAAFGWPTGVNPVPIAIARLETEKEVMPPDPRSTNKPTETPPRQKVTQPSGGAKHAFRDMRLPNQAGMLCAEVPFQLFLTEKHPGWLHSANGDYAEAVRIICGVKSRSEIRPRTPSGDRWEKLVIEYRNWLHAPELAS